MVTPEKDKELYEHLDALWSQMEDIHYDTQQFAYLVRWLLRADESERMAVTRWLRSVEDE